MDLLSFLFREKTYFYPEKLKEETAIIGLLRVRNEELILSDTLDHMGKIVDAIYVYDDCSTDSTLEILKANSKVCGIISNRFWRKGLKHRQVEETRHRQLLLSNARKTIRGIKWFFYFDADERFLGDIRRELLDGSLDEFDGIKINLFDAYITENDSLAYKNGEQLLDFRKFFGPEYREVLMIWKNNPGVGFYGLDKREPTLRSSNLISRFYCQHYGKSISIEQWEETCDYYYKNFPFETYGKKWLARKGKAIHQFSDFGRPLYKWGEELFLNRVKI